MTPRARGLTIAGALSIALALPFLVAQTGPVGGLPSKPRFQEVTVGTGGTNPGGRIRVNGTAHGYEIFETDAAADEKLWNLRPSAGCLALLTRTDANGVGQPVFDICRTGTNVDSVAFDTDAFTINGVGLPLGQVSRYKTVATDRASTTTSTADPHLTMPLAASTRYRCFLTLLPQGITTGTQGFKWELDYSGTFTDTPADIQQASINGAGSVFARVTSTNSHAHATISTASADQIEVTWSFQTNAAGTFEIAWAQVSSNANNTRLNRGSALLCQEIP